MGVTVARKVLSRTSMQCSDTAQVTLSLVASKSIITNPVDIMLVLDRSSSMLERIDPDDNTSPTKINALKATAKEFTQIIANASTNTAPPPNSPTIANSAIGVLSFATTASDPPDLALNHTVLTINTAIDALNADGFTNHADAFLKAQAALQPQAGNPTKIIVLITDGISTRPQQNPVGAANSAAATVKSTGTIIYCIGIGENAAEANLNEWATDEDHVLMAPNFAALQAAFATLAANIINPAPVNIQVVDTLTNNFEIVTGSIDTSDTPNGITVTATPDVTNKILTWKLSSLGTQVEQTASVTFNIRYTGTTSGVFNVNQSIAYTDATTQVPNLSLFTYPTGNSIDVTCGDTVNPDCDFPCKDVPVPCCGGAVDVDMPDAASAYDILCDGTLLNVRIHFQNICPNRKLAIGVIVCHKINGVEQPTAYRITTIDTPRDANNCACKNFVSSIEVLLPPPVPGSSCTTQRQVKVRVIAHYLAGPPFAPCNKCTR